MQEQVFVRTNIVFCILVFLGNLQGDHMKSCKNIAKKIIINCLAILAFTDVTAQALKHEQNEAAASLPVMVEIFKSKGSGIFLVVFIFVLIFVFYLIRTNVELKIRNRGYSLLAEISNEYFFEYDVKRDILILSEKSASLLGTERKFKGYGNSLKNHLVHVIHENSNKSMDLKKVMQENDKSFEVEIPLSDGSMGCFKVINTNIYGKNQKIEYVVGKLVDISEDVAEKKALIRKAQIDGMTGLYNPTSTREKIKNMLVKRQEGTVDAFILLDVDYFKEINDNYGHYTGDQVLQNLSETIRKTFRKTDVAGRFGGDEFCIYMQNIPSEKFVKSRCRQLNEEISSSVDGMNISLSIGISLVDEKKTFDDIYKEADHALYEAKRNGKNQFAVYEDKSNEK
jgi:diguanylate cyclase (GGDEF)-like protein